MTPAEIIRLGYLQDLVPPHLHGRTQDKTLHARLSEDVTRNNSRFFRTGPATFFLHSLLNDPTLPASYRKRYFAPPRHKELKRDPILTLYRDAWNGNGEKTDRIPLSWIETSLSSAQYTYSHWHNANFLPEQLPVFSFVVVHQHDQILSFRSGKLRRDSDTFLSKRSIGFTGPVSIIDDQDLLYRSWLGIVERGIKELIYGLGLPRSLAEDARYGNQVRLHFGVIEGSKRSLLKIVSSFRCPDEFNPVKTEMDDFQWIWWRHRANDTSAFDRTSRLLFKTDWLSEVVGLE